jgi:hypothetical protein
MPVKDNAIRGRQYSARVFTVLARQSLRDMEDRYRRQKPE